ncbi:MAG TPA: iron-sulfur cluster repair di-iron protein [Chitinophagaceae bacterium]|nr:iron-sulfur cluster repair di-iron protein [Chitinophagaceae bacterium]
MPGINTLDVTQIAPKLKHPTIFQHFDALQEGEAFIIRNDHDPKPLYYQLLGERGDIFTWEYLMQGPAIWLIKIARKNPGSGAETIGSIAAGDLRKAEIFKKFGLEFCCGGQKSLTEACAEAGVSEQQVQAELENLGKAPLKPQMDFNHWDLDFLADYIVNIHHKYLTDASPMLNDLSQKITQHHGGAHPELHEIAQHLTALLGEMRSHQIKEEKVLFPFIKQLVQCSREGKSAGNPPLGTLESPVQTMLDEHQSVAGHLHAMENLSGHYEVPVDGCESYRLYFHKLREFDEDLHQHIHLENNILFPKSVDLEKALTN